MLVHAALEAVLALVCVAREHVRAVRLQNPVERLSVGHGDAHLGRAPTVPDVAGTENRDVRGHDHRAPRLNQREVALEPPEHVGVQVADISAAVPEPSSSTT